MNEKQTTTQYNGHSLTTGYEHSALYYTATPQVHCIVRRHRSAYRFRPQSVSQSASLPAYQSLRY